MIFFCGMHHPHNAWRVPRAFVSVNALRRRRGDFCANDWILDSGAFSQITQHGDFLLTPEEYAIQIERWSRCGTLRAAVAQDYMCEPIATSKTGKTVQEHQSMTIERYDQLRKLYKGAVPIMPVLQGWSVQNYIDHLRAYGSRILLGGWVGVGSICKRNGTPFEVLAILRAIKTIRSDLRLHGFGLKLTALKHPDIRALLHSADSMAWSYAARRNGRNANDPQEAVDFYARITAF